MRKSRKKAEHERFWPKVDASGPCWLWTANTWKGYGKFGHVRAHRWTYEKWYGPIPDDLVIDHLCRNRACVRPTHLRAVTNYENITAPGSQSHALKTHCPYGHAYAGDNLYVSPSGHRRCWTCQLKRDEGRKR